MKYILRALVVLLLLTSFGNVKVSNAQITTPVTVKSDDVSDAQGRDMAQKARDSGMSDEQIRQQALKKGMSPTEVDKLQDRINIIRTQNNKETDNSKKDKNGREIVGDDTKKNDSKDDKSSGSGNVSAPGTAIFGSELFNNGNLTFEPNLRLPTPQNYRLGPDDQILINVYGKSQVDWKLSISPDGNIQIPGIGLVSMSGKTIEQATQIIKAKLSANNYAIGNGTTVAVSLGNIRSIKVIIVGEVAKPGTYTLSSLSTVFNALYASGGPNQNGSFRQIEIIRNNMVIRKLDVYDFLLHADQKDNIKLEDGDIVRVPTYKVHVTLTGQVKRQEIFEVLPGETLSDVIKFAGGFNDLAYTATIKVIQLTNQDMRITDLKAQDFDNYIPLRGDKYIVDRILDTYENRVSIYGAVVRPGQFELDKGLTLTGLINKASGLKPEVFSSRGFISRLKADNTTELVSFDIKSILNKTSPDIPLKREDVVTIVSIFDLRDQYRVSISGEVRSPGEFPYAEDMKVADLIVKAGGFTEGASNKRISVSRRVDDSDPLSKDTRVAEVFSLNIGANLKDDEANFVLKPFDMVSVYSLPGYEIQKTVKVEGEVIYPGYYTIQKKNEKISDIITRAGGFTASANVDGSNLKRVNTAVLGIDKTKSKIDTNALKQERADRMKRLQRIYKDSTNTDNDQMRNNFVGINLKQILQNPGIGEDLILEDGDILRVPKQQQTVRINGEVLFPSAVVYNNGKSFKGYVLNAGGYSPEALSSGAYVVYANGTVKGTRRFLFFVSHPRIKPGSEIFVPKKPFKKDNLPEILALTSSLVSMGAIILGVISLHK
jgi:protein involved in polysaccharide export with SLBB domain